MPAKPPVGDSADVGYVTEFFEELPYAVMAFSGAIISACVATIAVRVAVYAVTGI